MKQLIGIILVIGGIALGYSGYNKMQNSKADIKIGDLEISASDKSSSESAYLLLAVGAIGVIGGAVMLSRGKA